MQDNDHTLMAHIEKDFLNAWMEANILKNYDLSMPKD